YGERYTLSGYVADTFFSSYDGSRIYFNGCEGDEADRSKTGWSKAFALDLETKKVSTVPLPENHVLRAASPDGKTFVTMRRFDTDKGVYLSKNYLIPDGGKPVEILKENRRTPIFSPDGGSKLLVETGREVHVIDVATRATKPVRLPDA